MFSPPGRSPLPCVQVDQRTPLWENSGFPLRIGVSCTYHAHKQELGLDLQFHTIDCDKNDLGLKNFQSRYDWLPIPASLVPRWTVSF